IAGFAAGGGVDVTARLIGQWLTDRLGQSFVIENRPGAGGNIGTEAVVNAAPDGYTLLLATVPNAVNASLYEKLSFNFIRDIVPGYEASQWYGIGAPSNTPVEIVDKLNKEINAAIADPAMKARFAAIGGEPIPGSPAEFGKLISEETEKWGRVVRASGIKPE